MARNIETFDFHYEQTAETEFQIFVHGDALMTMPSKKSADNMLRWLVNTCCDDAAKISIKDGRTIRQ